MARRGLPGLLLGRQGRPRTTIRWRLTLLYGGLFLVSGAALLAITYALLARAGVAEAPQAAVPVSPSPPHFPGAAPRGLSSAAIAKLLHSAAGRPVFEAITHGQRASDLQQLLIWSAIALTIAAVASMLLGWLVAGRVLRPLRTITAATQQISETNLHQRLGHRRAPRRAHEAGRRRSTDSWSASRPRLRLSGGLWPTPRMSCAPRWRRCAPRSTSRSPSPTACRRRLRALDAESTRGPRPGRPAARRASSRSRARSTASSASRASVSLDADRRRTRSPPRRADRRETDRAAHSARPGSRHR